METYLPMPPKRDRCCRLESVLESSSLSLMLAISPTSFSVATSLEEVTEGIITGIPPSENRYKLRTKQKGKCAQRTMDAEEQQWFGPGDTGEDSHDGGRYSHVRSPAVRVPVHHQDYGSPDYRRTKRRFGAMNRRSQYQQRDSYRPAQGYDNLSSNSSSFERVASSVGRYNAR